MWAGTNFDYETDAVTDVYGPFDTKLQAVDAIRQRAESEFEVLSKSWKDAKIFDTLEAEGTLEITFDDANDNGYLYQIMEMEP